MSASDWSKTGQHFCMFLFSVNITKILIKPRHIIHIKFRCVSDNVVIKKMNRFLDISDDDCENLIKKKLFKTTKLFINGVVSLLN